MRLTTPRLPEPEGHRSGLIPSPSNLPELNLLFVGDSTMAGVGAPHQTAALPVQVATLLAGQLGRPIRWQVIARSGLTTAQTLPFLRTHPIPRADLLVTALGTNDVFAQTTPHSFLAAYEALLEALRPAHTILSGVPPLHVARAAPQPLRWYLGRYAHQLDRHLRQWAATRPHTTCVSLQFASNPHELASDGLHPGPAQYRAWAHDVANQAAHLLDHVP